MTATFRVLYVFVVIEHYSRRLIHCNVTAHPSSAWTLQQLREAVGFDERYEYLLHDRDSIFAQHLGLPDPPLTHIEPHKPIRAIDAENRTPSTPSRSWVGCITNTSLRPLECDAVFLRTTGRPVLSASLLPLAVPSFLYIL